MYMKFTLLICFLLIIILIMLILLQILIFLFNGRYYKFRYIRTINENTNEYDISVNTETNDKYYIKHFQIK